MYIYVLQVSLGTCSLTSLYLSIDFSPCFSLYRFSLYMYIYLDVCTCLYCRYPWVELPYSICCVLQCVPDCYSVFWWHWCLFAKTPEYYRLQIGWPKILRFFLQTFNLVPGEQGFSRNLSLVPCYHLVLLVNPMGRILLRWKSLRNHLKIFCHPICNRLYPCQTSQVVFEKEICRFIGSADTKSPQQRGTKHFTRLLSKIVWYKWMICLIPLCWVLLGRKKRTGRQNFLSYRVASISRLLKMIGLFCRILSLLWVSFAKETYLFKEPTNRSHPISLLGNRC